MKKKMIYQLKKEIKVHLIIENLKLRRKRKKFHYVKIKLFFVKTKIKTINYKLELPKYHKV